VRGFLGQYRATVEANGQKKIIEFSLPKSGANVDVRF
jgi:hypothetical protein